MSNHDDRDRGPGDRPGAPVGTGSRAAMRRVVRLRATVGRIAAVQVQQLRLVAAVAADSAAAARAELAGVDREWGVPSEEELTHTTVIHQLQVTLGIAKPAAERLLELATRLVAVLPETLAAVEAGRIDLARAEVLAQETAILDDAGARAVQALVLAKVADADGPWQTLSPRSWKAQIQRTVIQVDADAAQRRREQAIRDRQVRAWPQGDGTGVLQVIGQDSDIAFADRVLTNLALAGPAVGPDGERLSMDQRRVDGFMDLMCRVAFGDDLPQARAPREREVGIVAARGHPLRRRPRQERPRRAARSRRPRPHRPPLGGRAGPRRDRVRRRHPRPARRPRRCPATHHPAAEGAAGRLDPRPPGRTKSARPFPTYLTCRPSPTSRRWRSPTTSAPCTPGAPPMTAPGSRPVAIWTTTSPGPAAPPA